MFPLLLYLNVEAVPWLDALTVMDDCSPKSVVAPDLEEGLDVRGHYVVRILFTYLVHYYITLPILPRHTGYLQVDLILSSCSIIFFDILWIVCTC